MPKSKKLFSWKSSLKATSLLLVLVLCLSSGALAKKNKKKDDKMDPNKGTILLAGLVHSPESDTGGSKIADGIGGVPGAKVEMVGTGLVTETDKNGMFFFTKGPEGPVTVVISKEGYRQETVSAKIQKGAGMPENIRVELLPDGVQYVGKTPTGAGTLYVAYSPRVVEQSEPQSHGDPNLYDVRRAIIVDADPLTLEGNMARPNSDPKSKTHNPTTGADSTIMIYPPKSPGRTGFHNTSSAPYWLCFDKSGDTLYVAGKAQHIQVLDATDGNRTINNLPVQERGAVTSLSLSADGRYVMAAVMASSPGVMMIDTTTKQPAAYLVADGVGMMTPTAVATNPAGNIVYLALDGQMDQGGKGALVALNAQTGQTIGTASVGSRPNGMTLSADGRLAYVVNSSGGSVTVIDTASMSALGLIPVGVAPQKIALSPDGKRLLVTNKGSGNVSVIEATTGKVTNTISVGLGPTDVKFSPDGSRAYVSNRDDGTVHVIDMSTLNAIYATDAMPRCSPMGLAVRP